MSDPTDAPRPDTIVITGAAGWLGQNLVRAVAPHRSSVRCLVQTHAEAALLSLVSPAVHATVGDVRDPSALDALFEGTSGATVVHAAAVIHPRQRVRELHDVNVGGTALVLDRARRAGSGRVVHISSNSPFGANPSVDHRFTEDSPQNPYLGYGRSKADAEVLVATAQQRGDLETVVLRPPWFYGPFQPERQTQWFRAVRRGRFPLVGDGRNRRSMVFTGNLVHGVLRAEVAAKAVGGAYWVADGDPLEMRSILATVRRALVAEGLAVSGGQPRLPRLAGVVAERLDGALQARGRYIQALHVLGELKDTIACDISRARAEIGYDPPTDLEAGMRASIRWCLERGHAL
ncbi:MAG: NAD-dependent epimerase/dehydratase family protein [Microthrixaceae bacterium]